MGVPLLTPKDNISISHEDLQAALDIEGKKIEFLLDSAAMYCDPSTRKGPHSKRECTIKGVLRKTDTNSLSLCHVKKELKPLPHSFLYLPECLVSLLGRDLLSKLGAAIYLNKEKVEVLIPKDKGINKFHGQSPPGPERPGTCTHRNS